MGFFTSDNSVDCSRRTFLKGLFGATVVAVAVPKALSENGRYVIKLEKRFKHGEFVYIEYGKSIPIHVLNDEEIAHALIAEDIKWEDSLDALNKRANLMKELMFSTYEIKDEAKFDKGLEGLYDFLIAIDSALESTFVLFEFMDVGGTGLSGDDLFWNSNREVRKVLANHLIKNDGFKRWRECHRIKFANAHRLRTEVMEIDGRKIEHVIYDEEDMTLQNLYCKYTDGFPEFHFSDKERARIINIFKDPNHWLHDKVADDKNTNEIRNIVSNNS